MLYSTFRVSLYYYVVDSRFRDEKRFNDVFITKLSTYTYIIQNIIFKSYLIPQTFHRPNEICSVKTFH